MQVLEFLALCLALGGFGFGLYQFYDAQKWKRSELAAKQLERLSNDPKLAMCCLFLDWDIRKFPVPEEYKLWNQDDHFVHKWSELTKGMRASEGAASFPFPQLLYRDYFDYFFTYLEQVNHYIRIRLFSIKDVSSLEYWIRKIALRRWATEGQQNPFRQFLITYKYDGVFELMGRFKIEI